MVYFNQKNALIQRTTDQLKSVNILKQRMLENRLEDDDRFVNHFIKVVLSVEAQQGNFRNIFLYHQEYLKDFCQDYGHSGIFLIDNSGHVLDSILHNPGNVKGYTFDRTYFVAGKQYKIKLITNTDYTQKLLFENTGMGNSGESYLVDESQKMISKSRFFPEKLPQSILVNTKSVQLALENKTGTCLIKDYREIDVLSAYAPIHVGKMHWAILSEIDLSEAMLPVRKLRDILLIVSLIILIAAFIVAYFLGKIIVTPIRQVSNGMLELSQGIIPLKISGADYDSEESLMKRALNRLIGSFNGVSNFASEIGSGNLKADFSPLGPNDELSKSLIQMRDQLIDYQEKEKSLRRQKALSLIEGQENERRRIAMDLHDGLGQWLTGIKLKIAVLTLPENQREELKAMVSETINETRRITNNLMPNTLVDFGLDSALRQMIANLTKDAQSQLSYHFHREKDLPALPFEISLSLYRIAQEAINNALKHSHATDISLEVTVEKDFIELIIEDNGVGIKDSVNNGNGLGNMDERAKLVRGIFTLEQLNPGTLIRVNIPLS